MGISKIKRKLSKGHFLTLENEEAIANKEISEDVSFSNRISFTSNFRPLESIINERDPDLYTSLIQNDLSNYNIDCHKFNELDSIKKYPTCLIRSIFQHYECQSNNIKKLLKKLQWNSQCFKENMFVDLTKYVNCDGIAKRIIKYDENINEPQLVKYHFGNNKEEALKKLNDSLFNLCQDDKNYPKTLCAAYEFRDEFKEEPFIKFKLLQNCNNTFYKERIERIGSVVKFYEEDKHSTSPISVFNRKLLSIENKLENEETLISASNFSSASSILIFMAVFIALCNVKSIPIRILIVLSGAILFLIN